MNDAATAASSCGRDAPLPAPGPVLRYSKNRAAFHEKPDMSVHGAAAIAGPSQESRTTTCAIALGSPPGCHGRPSLALPSVIVNV